MRVARKQGIQPLLFAAAISLLATGCRTYEQQNRVIQSWHQGNLPSAAAEATKMADQNANNKDAIVWRLEQGAALRGNGQCEASNKAFDQAQDRIDQYSQEAKVKVGNEAGALLSNQANLPYTGRAYDGIMLNTYKALNYLQLGEPDKARVELIRAYQRQQDAVADNQRRIEKVQGEAAKSKDKATMDKAQQDPGFQSQVQGTCADLDRLKPYANYVNPFTVYLDGLFFMANAADASDLERAHKSLERVAGFADGNDYVKQDLATLDNLMKGKPLTPTTYVIFETGCAPLRGQIRIDIPIIVTKVSYVGAAFPTLKPQGNYLPSLTVTANGTSQTTSLIAGMDSVIGLDFKNEMPVVITKTIAATVTKAVAAYAVNEAANQQSSLLGFASQIGTAVAQVAVNIADTRTWTTLPKEFQACRIPTPPDRKIELTVGGSQKTSVTIADGTINIVYVKSINPGTPLLVTQIKLK
jgi:hypothetical protein